MARQITGTLKAPDGSVLAAVTLKFTAVRNELSGVPKGVSAETTTDASGVYDLNVELGYYQVTLVAGTTLASLGKVLVESGAAVELVALLGASQEDLDLSLLGSIQEEVAAAQRAATDAAASETGAAASAQTAENARDAATVSAEIYADTAAGLAATVDGDYFKALAATAEGFLTLYRNDAGVATEIETFPSLSGLAAAVRVANQKTTRLSRSMARLSDNGQTLHSDFAYEAYGVGSPMAGGVDTALGGEELWTCTRSTPKWVMQPSGPSGEMLLTEVPADTLAREWDPATGECKGVLIEETRTNTQTHGEATAGWSAARIDIAYNAAVGIDGQTTATTATANTEGGNYVYRHSESTAGVTYTLSAHYKPGTYTKPIMLMAHGNAVGANERVTFDPIAEMFTEATTAIEGYGFQKLPGGWYRIWLTITAINTQTSGYFLLIWTKENMLVGETFHWQKAQVEEGAYPTSYIPTTTTPVTRAADSVIASVLSPWFNHAQGALVIDAEWIGKPNTYSYIAALSDGTVNDAIAIGWYASSSLRGYIASGGVGTHLTNTAGRISAGAPVTLGLTYDSSGAMDASDGVLAATSADIVIPEVDRLEIGRLAGSASYGYSVRIKSVTYYPYKMTQTELEQLTA